MTYEEAIEHGKWNLDIFGGEHRKFIERSIEALEKQMPKMVVRRVVNRGFNLPMPIYVDVCPSCGVDTLIPRELERWEFWCPDCGQRLEWSTE